MSFQTLVSLSTLFIVFFVCPTNVSVGQTKNEPTITVRGQIIDSNKKAVADCTLEYSYHRNLDPINSKCDAEGKFEFDVPEEKLGWLIARSPDQSKVAYFSLQGLNSESIKKVLKIELEKCLTTVVEVRHNGKPLSDALVFAEYTWRLRTGVDGKATLRVPRSKPISSVWVFDKTKGIAFWYPEVKPSSTESTRKNQPKKLVLDLLPTRKCKVLVTNENEEPMVDFEIFPYFRVEGDTNRKFLPGMPETYGKTDQSGIAVFEWMPATPVTWFIPTIVDKKNYRNADSKSSGTTEQLRKPDKTLVVKKLQRKVKVVGKVIGPAGADLAGIIVQASSYAGATGFYKFTSVTKSNGEFEADVMPGLEYHVVAMGNKWSSDPAKGILVDPSGNSNDPIRLKLYASTPVAISVTQGNPKSPVTTGDVLVEQNVQVAKATVSLRRYLRVDSNGQVKFGVGKGNWTFTSRTGKVSKELKAEIVDTKPLALFAHYQWAGEQEIVGTVTNEKGEAIEKVDITLIDYEFLSHSFETQSDAKGNWSVNTDVRPNFAVLAIHNDKKLASLKLVHGPTGLPAKLKLAPTATVKGVLLDPGGKPAPAGGVILLIHDVKTKINGVAVTKKVICGQSTTNVRGEYEFQVPSGINLRLGFKLNELNSRYFQGQSVQYSPHEVVEKVLELGKLKR